MIKHFDLVADRKIDVKFEFAEQERRLVQVLGAKIISRSSDAILADGVTVHRGIVAEVPEIK
jgi:hypothetical protein